MGNKVPRISVPMSQIEVVPGNVLIDVYDGHKITSTSSGNSEISGQNLYWGYVMRVASANHPPKVPNAVANAGANNPKHLKKGDMVLVRGDKGYPVDTLEGQRLFVVNEWDVALKLGDLAVSVDKAPAAADA